MDESADGAKGKEVNGNRKQAAPNVFNNSDDSPWARTNYYITTMTSPFHTSYVMNLGSLLSMPEPIDHNPPFKLPPAPHAATPLNA